MVLLAGKSNSMKQIFTLFLGLSLNAATAQVLLSTEMLPVTAQMNYMHPVDFNIVDTTVQGANKTWDFHTLQPDNAQGNFQITILNPAATPYAASFPGANYCMVEMPDPFYSYYNKTSSIMERLGSGSSSGINTFSDTQIEYVFPLQLGTVHNDTWFSSNNSFVGNYNLACVGNGTLKLPNATYSNVLMVRVDFDNGIFSFPIYFWYSSDNGGVLFEYIVGDGGFIPESGVYLISMSIGIEENELPYRILYNNPVQEQLTVLFTGKNSAAMEYNIVSSLGEIVSSGTFRSEAQQAQTLSIDMSGFSAGIYFVRFMQEEPVSGETQSIKIIKR